MTLPYSKPPLCRTGHSRTDRYSPAWDKADDIVALYSAKDGHKTIAKRLGISPRIAREILIERFHYSNARPMWHIDNVLKSDTWTA